jgi:hypothetical protein
MKTISLLLLALLLAAVTIQGQVNSERLSSISTKLAEKIEKSERGWTHRSITPMEGSRNLIVDQWESSEVTLKVVVTEYKTQDAATNALKVFKENLKTEEGVARGRGKADFRLVKDELPTIGDGGFTWDILGSEATAFRRENFLVFVSTSSESRDRKDLKLSKEFAKHVADVLKSL